MSFIIPVGTTFGALSTGFNLSCIVFGILTTQTYNYLHKNYSLDRPIYLFLVSFLWILECSDQGVIGHAVYYYTITNYGNSRVLVEKHVMWSLLVQVLLGVLVSTIVKTCFAIRVWRFSGGNILVTLIISLLIATQFVTAIVYVVHGFHVIGLLRYNQLKTIATLSLATAVMTDITISLALCFFIRRLRAQSAPSPLSHTLILYAVGTGALTGTVNACTLILYNTYPDTFYCIASYFVLGKCLYAISLICALNTRAVIRGKPTDKSGGDGSPPPTSVLPPTPSIYQQSVVVTSTPPRKRNICSWLVSVIIAKALARKETENCWV